MLSKKNTLRINPMAEIDERPHLDSRMPQRGGDCVERIKRALNEGRQN